MLYVIKLANSICSYKNLANSIFYPSVCRKASLSSPAECKSVQLQLKGGIVHISLFNQLMCFLFLCWSHTCVFDVILKGRSWIVKRSYEDFRVLDKHLHLCIYDRRFSQLPELPRLDSLTDQSEVSTQHRHLHTDDIVYFAYGLKSFSFFVKITLKSFLIM